jgi:hypothetical protein
MKTRTKIITFLLVIAREPRTISRSWSRSFQSTRSALAFYVDEGKDDDLLIVRREEIAKRAIRGSRTNTR